MVTFPEPLDHGLLLRALGVLAPDGTPLDGEMAVGTSELKWTFTPEEPWTAGELQRGGVRDAGGSGRQPHRPRV